MTNGNRNISLETAGITGAMLILLGGVVGCPSGGAPPAGGGTTPLVCVPLSTDITTDTTLALPCYDVTSDVFVENGATLTINPGVTLRFAIDTKLQISSDGTLKAVGTAADPILLTGAQKTRGFWGGLYFRDSSSFDNRLDYVTIEFGGGTDFAAGAQGDVVLQQFGTDPVRINMTHCTFRESSTYGFYFDTGSVVDSFGNNTVTANTLGAGYVVGNVAGILDDTGSYTGNDADVVIVEGDTIDTDQTWSAIDADYLMTDRSIVDAFLTVAAGARLVFRQDATLEIMDTGTLSAIGTAAEPIVFTGEQTIRGFWGGVYFRDSNSFDNQLDYVTIEFGGGTDFAGGQGDVVLQAFGTAPVRANLTNCTFRESSTYGIWAGRDAIVNADVQTVNTFSNNALGDFFREP